MLVAAAVDGLVVDSSPFGLDSPLGSMSSLRDAADLPGCRAGLDEPLPAASSRADVSDRYFGHEEMAKAHHQRCLHQYFPEEE